jgi:2-phosphosulfolactate phosphatase
VSEAAFTSQSGFDVRFEWGESGLQALLGQVKTIAIFDVLSFTTCVSLACARGARVFPFPWKDERVTAFAAEKQALVAGPRWDTEGYTLSPASLTRLPRGATLVLPSPNGSHLSHLAAQSGAVFAGALRNVSALAARMRAESAPIAVIAAGERWPDGRLRPCVEDMVGAGALIARLPGSLSPEAELARSAWEKAASSLERLLRGCASGIELAQRGFARDVALAAELDADAVAPVLQDGAFAGGS